MKFKFYYTFYLFCLFTTQLFAQTDYRKTYYPLINKAELAILDENYQEALTFYDQAFAQNKPFAKDIHNAALCGMKLENKTIAKKYLIKFAKKGLLIERIEENDNFFSLKTDSDWLQFRDMYNQFYQPSVEMFETAILDSLKLYSKQIHDVYTDNHGVYFHFESNGRVRISTNDTTLLKDVMQKIEVKRDSLERIVDKLSERNSNFSDKILKEKGYLGENEVGIFSPEGNTMFSYFFEEYGRNKRLEFDTKNSTTMILNSSFDSDYYLPIFQKAVIEGKLSNWNAYKLLSKKPLKMVEILQVNIENKEGCSEELLGKVGKWLIRKKIFSPDEKENYQKNQDNFGIESAEDLMRKELFRIKNSQGFIFDREQLSQEMTTLPNCELALKELIDFIEYEE